MLTVLILAFAVGWLLFVRWLVNKCKRYPYR